MKIFFLFWKTGFTEKFGFLISEHKHEWKILLLFSSPTINGNRKQTVTVDIKIQI